jgi:transglutaminase-like putative cysteine protease
MGKQVALHHRTQYRYDKAVTLGPQVIQLRPAPYCRTPILSYALQVMPEDRLLNWQLDPHSNWSARLIFPSKTNEFVVDVRLIADLSPINPFDFYLEPGAISFRLRMRLNWRRIWSRIARPSLLGTLQQAFLDKFSETRLKDAYGRDSKYGTVSLLLDLNRGCGMRWATRRGWSRGSGCEETLERDGVVPRFGVAAGAGAAASGDCGAVCFGVSDSVGGGGEAGGPAGPKKDSADLHAWAEAYLPGAGWIGLDPTSGLFTGEGHIPLVCTPKRRRLRRLGGRWSRRMWSSFFSMSVRAAE